MRPKLFFLWLVLAPALVTLTPACASDGAALAVFVTNPDTREVKNTLSKELSPRTAYTFYQHCLSILSEDLERLSQDFTVYICPAGEETDRAWVERHWPNYELLCVEHTETLGAKIQCVVNTLLEKGHSQAHVIRSDAPSLPPFYICQCQDLLSASDMVLGPNQDGGYYLIGARSPLKDLEFIHWSCPTACRDTKNALEGQGWTVAVGSEWYDVDEASELWKLEVDLVGCRGPRAHLLNWVKTLPHVTVVIPILNEAALIATMSEQLHELQPRPEVIFVDGGSSDSSVEEGSRGHSLNAGIAHARAPIVLFLHADSELSQEAYDAMLHEFEAPGLLGGAFTLELKGSEEDWRKRTVEFMVAARNKLFHMPYGNQAYFVRKKALEDIGWFRDIPVMEDVEWFGRLKDAGPYVILGESVRSAGRRIFRQGWVKTSFVNASLITLYKMGVHPEFLHRWISVDKTEEPEESVVLVQDLDG